MAEALRPEAPGEAAQPWSLRPATAQDLPFLMQLRLQTMQAYLLAAGVDLNEAEHLARIQHRFELAQILMLDDTAAGLVKLAREPAGWELLQVQIAPSLQGRGLGRALIDQSREARVPLRLHVLKQNPARHLYERLGFEHIGEDALEYEMQLRP